MVSRAGARPLPVLGARPGTHPAAGPGDTGASWGQCVLQGVGAGGAGRVPTAPGASAIQVINRSSTELPLTVSYDKISLGRLRFWIHMQDAVYALQQFGDCPLTPGCYLWPGPGPKSLALWVGSG